MSEINQLLQATNTIMQFLPIIVIFAVVTFLVKHIGGHDFPSHIGTCEHITPIVEEYDPFEEDNGEAECQYCGSLVIFENGRCPICSAPKKFNSKS